MNLRKKISLLALLSMFIGFGQVTYQLNSTAPTTNTLTSLLSTIGTSQATIIINKNVLLTAPVTIPSNVTLSFVSGSLITLATHDLTINGSIEAGVYQIFDDSSTGVVNGSPLIENAVPHWWKRPSDTYWTKAIQSAVNFYPKVFFPARPDNNSPYFIDNSIKLNLSRGIPDGYHLSGVGRASFFVFDVAASVNYVFECINTPSDGYFSGLTFEHLTMFCRDGKGIKISGGNPAGETFTNESYPISNVKITNCQFNLSNSGIAALNNGPAIFLRKVFDSQISNNLINGCGYGIKLEGSDLNSINDNRIMNFYYNCILDLSFTTETANMGSQNAIIHNDLLAYRGTAGQNSFIKSLSNHIIIRDNYMENQTSANKLFAYIDCTLDKMPTNYAGTSIATHTAYHIDITGNRCDAIDSNATYIYFLPENFRSLNLVDISGYTFPELITNIKSTFSKITATNPYVCTETNQISLKCGDTQFEKLINITNSIFFKNWDNFSSSRIFTNTSKGDIVIDSRSISSISNHYTPNALPTFNPRSFIIDDKAAGSASYPAIYLDFNQKLSGTDLGDLFTNINIKLKVRNLPVAGVTGTVTADDLYLKIEDVTNPSSPIFIYDNPSINIVDGNNYCIINIPVLNSSSVPIAFDSSKKYQLAISSKSKFAKEFKEITIEDASPVITDSSKSAQQPVTTPIASDEEGTKENEEQTRTLTVKVDNNPNVYPNPTPQNLTIDIKSDDVLKSVELYTETGAFIGDYTKRVNNNTIDISALPNAVYIIKFITVSNTVKKIIKE